MKPYLMPLYTAAAQQWVAVFVFTNVCRFVTGAIFGILLVFG